VTGAIVGSRSPSQVDGWIDAATLTLNPNDLDEIAASIEKLGVGSGPTRPPSPPRGTIERPAVESQLGAR
jgi:hypothetical protein